MHLCCFKGFWEQGYVFFVLFFFVFFKVGGLTGKETDANEWVASPVGGDDPCPFLLH